MKMKYSGSYVFYDSSSVLKNDAKVIGVLLEE